MASVADEAQSGEAWTAIGVAYALLPVVAFGVTFWGYATNVFTRPEPPGAIPEAALAVGFLASVLAIGARRGLLVAWVSAFCTLFGFTAYGHFLAYGPGFTARRLVEFVDLGGALMLVILSGVVGPVGYTVGGLIRWAVGELRAFVLERTD